MKPPSVQASEQLWRDGVCIVSDIVDQDLMQECLVELQTAHSHFFNADETPEKLFVSEGRFYSALEISGSFARPEVLLPPGVEQVLCECLGPDFVFDSWGIINALPGAGEQHWHRDGGILFPSNPINAMLPPSAITLAIPLVEMNHETGTTGFSIKSHRANGHKDRPDYQPIVPVGSAVLWDYRVFHKGMPNKSNTARPLIYATACRDWWHDTLNHESEDRLLVQGSVLDGLGVRLQKRLQRAKVSR